MWRVRPGNPMAETRDTEVPRTDRRQARRLSLSLPVHLIRVDSPDNLTAVESTTINVSSTGFYCMVTEQFQVGERLRCLIGMPASSGNPSESITLECRARVVRTEQSGSRLAIACHIEEYRVLSAASGDSRG